MAVHLAQGRGLGLADMLVRQLQGAISPATAATASETSATMGSGSTSAPLATSKADFVRQMLPHAEAAARELGVDPHALLAQAALETGWGASVPCNSAGECSFNLFGIKAGSQWTGASVNVPTLEFEDGVAVRKVERFRAYESAAESFRDYARLIGNNARYENAVGAGDNVAAFAAALQHGGYVTDPQYARKLVAVADEVRKLTNG
jgi:flagellar protein FlgJ